MAVTAIIPSILLIIYKLKYSVQSSQSLTTLLIRLCNELHKLNQTAKSIHAVLNDAQKKAGEDINTINLISKHKSADFDAEDAVDDLGFELVSLSRSEADDQNQISTEVCNSITCLSHRIRYINERFEEILSRLDELHLRENHGRMPNLNSESLANDVLYSRENDKRSLIDLLIEEKPGIPCAVLPLIGASGIGKTTLVRSIYEDSRICRHFDRRGWVLNSKNYDPIMLMRSIMESVTESSWSKAELSTLQTSINYELGKKRFLIVLDDYSLDNLSVFESVRGASLTRGHVGSKILLITREESVVKAFQTMQSYRLDRLPEDGCRQLFLHHAFPFHEHATDQKLILIGERIVQKCKGMLLPIKMIAATLCHEADKSLWEDICDSDQWDSDVSQNLLRPAFELCYDILLPQLKLCLAYCSFFPDSHIFDKSQLVRLWKAQGYIDPVEGMRLDEIGSEIFDELFRRSFFHISHANKQAYVMHHQICELIHNLSGDEFSKIEDEKADMQTNKLMICNVSEKARHQSFITKEDGAVLELNCSAESTALRSFLLITKSQSSSIRRYCGDQDHIHLSFHTDLFIKMRTIRAIDLSYTDIQELPDSIGSCIHLRFLGLNSTKIKSLPESFSNLYNLQTLEMENCSYFLALPAGISFLSNLQYLSVSKPYYFVLLPRGIGKLTNLITLSTFYIGRDSSYYVIRELESLVNLRGELHISGLSNVITAEDAMAANLKNKEFVQKLILEWQSSDVGSQNRIIRHLLNVEKNLPEHENDLIPQNEEENDTDAKWITQIDISYKQVQKSREERTLNRRKALELREGVLQNLYPHYNLKELVIENYEGIKLARWMGDSRLSKLESITLSNCTKCEVLPSLGRLPFLKNLLLKGFSKLKYVGDDFCGEGDGDMKPFSSLKKLEFEGMYAWEEWNGSDGAFPRLMELSLNYCHKLRTMPLVFPSLEKLTLRNCTELTSFPAAPLLSSLEVLRCSKKMMLALPEQMAKAGTVKFYGEKFAEFTLC